MTNLEKALSKTDFSRNTDLKARLASRLFGQQTSSSSKVIAFPFSRISDDEAELVNAAQGLVDGMPVDPEMNK